MNLKWWLSLFYISQMNKTQFERSTEIELLPDLAQNMDILEDVNCNDRSYFQDEEVIGSIEERNDIQEINIKAKFTVSYTRKAVTIRNEIKLLRDTGLEYRSRKGILIFKRKMWNNLCFN